MVLKQQKADKIIPKIETADFVKKQFVSIDKFNLNFFPIFHLLKYSTILATVQLKYQSKNQFWCSFVSFVDYYYYYHLKSVWQLSNPIMHINHIRSIYSLANKCHYPQSSIALLFILCIRHSFDHKAISSRIISSIEMFAVFCRSFVIGFGMQNSAFQLNGS